MQRARERRVNGERRKRGGRHRFAVHHRKQGGNDRGPRGGEYLLIAIGGCFLSTLLAAVKTRGADVSDVRVVVVGTIEGTPERFESMALHVTAKYADEDVMHKLVEIAERGCLVSNTLKDAVRLSVIVQRAA